MNNCEKAGKFVEAEMAKQKVAQLRQVEKEKLLDQTKKLHMEQVN
jgi:hypothetical protein